MPIVAGEFPLQPPHGIEGAATTAAAVADFFAIAVALIVQVACAMMGAYLAMGLQYGCCF